MLRIVTIYTISMCELFQYSCLGWPHRIGSPTEVRRFGADESIFGQNSDPIAKIESKKF